MLKLEFYVPVDASQTVKNAIFAAGGGAIGNYQKCCWETLGQGQFEAKVGADPHIGEIDSLKTLPELKVELVCSESIIKDVVSALKKSHPYEEPAYNIIQLLNI